MTANNVDFNKAFGGPVGTMRLLRMYSSKAGETCHATTEFCVEDRRHLPQIMQYTTAPAVSIPAYTAAFPAYESYECSPLDHRVNPFWDGAPCC